MIWDGARGTERRYAGRRAGIKNMMRITGSVGTYTEEGNRFRGYDRNPFGSAGAFCEMRNMSGWRWPVVSTRGKRRRVRGFEHFRTLFGHDALGWIDGTEVWYNGQQVGTVTEGEKVICEMGAKVCIWPDKKILNTVDGTWQEMEQHTTISGEITYITCDLLGEPVTSVLAVYVKVSAAGIGQGLKDYDVVEIAGSEVLTSGAYQVHTVTDNSLIVLATMTEDSATQTGGLTLDRSVPDMDFMTECDNRIWGCSNATHEVYACALGDPTNWRTYQGLATDAYAMTVGTPGKFTGMTTHLGYVLIFKEDAIHKLFGNKPSNYQLTTTHARGVEEGSAKSLCVMNETLYYLSPTGMVSFEGSLPSDISEALGHVKYKNAVCGAIFGRLYVSMEEENGSTHLFTYDGQQGYWYRQDSARALAFRYAGGGLYMVDTDGVLWKMEGYCPAALEDETAADEGVIEWEVQTGDLQMENLYKRRLQKILLRFRLLEDAEATVEIQCDGGPWQILRSYSGKTDKKAVSLPLIPRRCDHMRIRMRGNGDVRLLNMNYITWRGTDL